MSRTRRIKEEKKALEEGKKKKIPKIGRRPEEQRGLEASPRPLQQQKGNKKEKVSGQNPARRRRRKAENEVRKQKKALKKGKQRNLSTELRRGQSPVDELAMLEAPTRRESLDVNEKEVI